MMSHIIQQHAACCRAFPCSERANGTMKLQHALSCTWYVNGRSTIGVLLSLANRLCAGSMSWKSKLFTWKSAFLFSGFFASMTGATIFARRIPDVISFNKKEVMKKRREERRRKELENKVGGVIESGGKKYTTQTRGISK